MRRAGAAARHIRAGLAAEDPPEREGDQDQAAEYSGEEFHALLSVMEVASWTGRTVASLRKAATGRDALH